MAAVNNLRTRTIAAAIESKCDAEFIAYLGRCDFFALKLRADYFRARGFAV